MSLYLIKEFSNKKIQKTKIFIKVHLQISTREVKKKIYSLISTVSVNTNTALHTHTHR